MAGTIEMMIVDEEPYLQKVLKPMIQQNPRLEIVGECQSQQKILRMVEGHHPHIVLINFDIPGFNAVETTRNLLRMNPDLLILMIFSQESKHFIKEALAAGINQYIMKPFTDKEIITILTNLYDGQEGSKGTIDTYEKKKVDKKKNKEMKSQIITLFALKGGVGKSVLAVNLAIALIQKTGKPVAVVDLDLQSGDIALLMNLFPKRTITELVKDFHSLEEEIMDEYLTVHSSGVRVLCAPISPEFSEYITTLKVEKVIHTLCKTYEYVIIDTAPSFGDINLTALDMSDKVLFVSTLDLPSIKNVKAGLQILNKLNYPQYKVNLVLNRYNRDLGISIRNLEKSTGKKLLATIPEDYDTVTHAVNQGEPFILKNAKKSVAKNIQGLADKILTKG